MLLSNAKLKFGDIIPNIEFLMQRRFEINQSKLIDETWLQKQNLPKLQSNDEFAYLFLEKKMGIFLSLKQIELCHEFLKICQFYFAIPAHNAAG